MFLEISIMLVIQRDNNCRHPPLRNSRTYSVLSRFVVGMLFIMKQSFRLYLETFRENYVFHLQAMNKDKSLLFMLKTEK